MNISHIDYSTEAAITDIKDDLGIEAVTILTDEFPQDFFEVLDD